ncbi:hypothetical protein Pan14r_45960 [Crateriforma conspicua]|uniref:Chromosome partition protein Smc n=2 Tax=Crateriforma conspicua TaxID=2527996 RepID=A0A5C5YBH0_9PLAN|nr:hypothetical protein Pan14r_45960 [Crateriforma conspicua]
MTETRIPAKPTHQSFPHNPADTMKTLIASSITTAALIVASSTSAYGANLLSSPCGCAVEPVCAPAIIVIPSTACGDVVSVSDMGTVDHPSQLNILLTEELVALRQQVDELTASGEQTAKALSEAKQMIAKMRKQTDQLKQQLAKEKKRSQQAEDQLAASKKVAAEAKTQAIQARDEAQKQIRQLTRQNGNLQKSLNQTKSALQAANQTLKEERKKEIPEKEEKGIETSPASIRDEQAGNGDEATGDDAPLEG